MPPLRYLDDEKFPELPSHGLAADDQARIIDLNFFNSETDTDNLTAIDAAITLLYNYNPDAARAFIDSNVRKVEFVREGGGFCRFRLMRHIDTVWISFSDDNSYTPWDTRELYGSFKAGKYVKYKPNTILTMFKIISAESEDYFPSPKAIQEDVAKKILTNKFWEECPGIKISYEQE